MPNCFTLTKIGEDKPSRLPAVDDAICAHLGITPHEKFFAHRWYDLIGLSLALGHSWEKIREIFADDGDLLKIAQFLQDNYTVNAWAER